MSKELIPNYSLNSLLRALESGVIGAMRRCQDGFHQAELAQNATLYAFLAFIVQFVRQLKSDNRDFNEFMQEARHQCGSPNGLKGDRLSILAVKMMMQVWASTSPRYEQVRVYGKVVEHFVSRDIVAEDIPQAIEDAGGIYKLLEGNKPSNQESRNSDGSNRGRHTQTGNVSRKYDAEDEQDNVVDQDDTDENDRNDYARGSQNNRPVTPNGQPKNSPTASPSGTLSSLRRNFDPSKDLVIDAEHKLAHLLAYEDGKTCWLKVEKLVDKDGWKRFELIDLRE